jgi:hypothetical protein
LQGNVSLSLLLLLLLLSVRPPPPLFALSPSLSASTNANAQEDDDAKELQVQREIEQDKLYGRASLALQEKKREEVDRAKSPPGSPTARAALLKRQSVVAARAKAPEAQFTDNRNGTHTLSYHVDSTGSWNMHIKLKEQAVDSRGNLVVDSRGKTGKSGGKWMAINGSPWVINTAPTLIDPKKCILTGLAPVHTQSLTPASFTITAVDRLGNRLHGGFLKYDVRMSSPEMIESLGGPLRGTVEDNFDGSYRVSMPLTFPGTHSVTATCKQAVNAMVAGMRCTLLYSLCLPPSPSDACPEMSALKLTPSDTPRPQASPPM